MMSVHREQQQVAYLRTSGRWQRWLAERNADKYFGLVAMMSLETLMVRIRAGIRKRARVK